MRPQTKKIKVGILGEHPENDAEAFKILLSKRPYDNVQFVVPIRGLLGDQLKNIKAVVRQLKLHILQDELTHFIIIHDLDGIVSEIDKIAFWDDWFAAINKEIANCGIFYLVIAETEALILSDVKAVNNHFGTKLKPYKNPMSMSDPKKELREQTGKVNLKKRYDMYMARDIFNKLDFQAVYQNHKGKRSFQEFIHQLDDILK
jgi:hypothetical protein